MLEELGIVIDTNPLEVLSFKKFSGLQISLFFFIGFSFFLLLHVLKFQSFSSILMFSCFYFLTRVANEIHSSATKKNKEWQEKLPVVVLKAEEIMYSKANSEVKASIFLIFLVPIETLLNLDVVYV